MDHSGDALEMHRDRLDHPGRGRGGCASASRPVAIAASARSPHGRAGCDRGDTRSDTGAGSIAPALPGVRVPHGSWDCRCSGFGWEAGRSAARGRHLRAGRGADLRLHLWSRAGPQPPSTWTMANARSLERIPPAL